MARREGGGPGALIEQRAGPGGYHSAALVEPARHLLPRLLQPGRGDQLETEDSGARFQRKGNSPIHNTMLGMDLIISSWCYNFIHCHTY